MNLQQIFTQNAKQILKNQKKSYASLGTDLNIPGSAPNKTNRAKKMIEKTSLTDLSALSEVFGKNPTDLLQKDAITQIGDGNVVGKGNTVHINSPNKATDDKKSLLRQILSLTDPEERKMALKMMQSE